MASSAPADETLGPSPYVHRPEELTLAFTFPLGKLMHQDPESLPFKTPVDPITLEIPDYFDVVKRPMDLSTIHAKLIQNGYTSPWDFVNDVWLMFDNAWLYNRESSRVYRYCTKMAEVFENEINPVMQRLGYCCGGKLVLAAPKALICQGGEHCVIPPMASFYGYQNKTNFCIPCFNRIGAGADDKIEIFAKDSAGPAHLVKKDQFLLAKNENCDPEESFVLCQGCGRKFHKNCVLHSNKILLNGFHCGGCLEKNKPKNQPNA